MESNLYLNILPEEQKKLFYLLSEQEWIDNFYLAGGTGLSLQTGHRQSIDFDFFTSHIFDNSKITNYMKNLGHVYLSSEAKNTLHLMINGLKISFFHITFPLLASTTDLKYLHIAHILDIAVMKLNAISGRGSKKDFIDLYIILEKYFSLTELLKKYEEKYGVEVANNYHLLKSLIYFEDAEREPSPKMLIKLSWKKVKENIIKHLKKSTFF